MSSSVYSHFSLQLLSLAQKSSVKFAQICLIVTEDLGGTNQEPVPMATGNIHNLLAEVPPETSTRISSFFPNLLSALLQLQVS